MVDPMSADICPFCGEKTMGKWQKTSTARRCGWCGHIEERPTHETVIKDWIKKGNVNDIKRKISNK
jgi:hypothetical protein